MLFVAFIVAVIGGLFALIVIAIQGLDGASSDIAIEFGVSAVWNGFAGAQG